LGEVIVKLFISLTIPGMYNLKASLNSRKTSMGFPVYVTAEINTKDIVVAKPAVQPIMDFLYSKIIENKYRIRNIIKTVKRFSL
jgi:hypothetical protein